MATKATTEKTTADSAAVSDSDIVGPDSAVLSGTVPDIAGSGDEGATTSPSKPEPAAAPSKVTAGRTSARRTSKGENKDRVEEYISHKPDGNGGYIEVTVRRNIDTGASEIVDG